MNKCIVFIFLSFFLFCGLTGCSGLQKDSKSISAIYSMSDEKSEFSPVFEIQGYEKDLNRIGTPSAVILDGGDEEIIIDITKPSVFTQTQKFKTENGSYTNRIYRVHFPRVPYFHLTAGNNVGLLVIVTMDSSNKAVLVTTVHTCGCYNAIIPTNYLQESAYPDGWNKESFDLYGETLPGMIDLSNSDSSSILLKIRPDVHRVMDIRPLAKENLNASDERPRFEMKKHDMSELEKISAGEGKTVNFFHKDGLMKGHVKGTVKPLEMMFMSLISLDLFVGSDKIYSPPDEYGNPFYTSLKPWNRNESDMRDFAGYLKFWGWKL
ncbi:hypothetical protein [Desulforegula conservatrix]|uniref:hypothetical protein n=1 Tax=Desulforegula conservatrix TaxID=153026 RepID=UPI0012EC85C4|nr:hypothetical protein [Desulforegula conservatrix]